MTLDPYQQAAVETTAPRVIAVACPGSGKTRTLVSRFLHMRKVMGIPASEIVLLTFTRYAATELKERIGHGQARGAFIGTFHSFALHLLKMYGATRGWDPEWLTILDDAETDLDEREVMVDRKLIDRKGRWANCRAGDWYDFKTRLTSGVWTFDAETCTVRDAMFYSVWKSVEDRLRAENVLTYSTLLMEAIAMLQTPAIIEAARARFRHFLVDEAQDTDGNQWKLVDLFDPKTRWVCGDGDQAIYEWRGARPELFIAYGATATRYDLPNSYRFGINLAEPANRLIRHNTSRLEIAINAISENHGRLIVKHNVPYTDVAALVAEDVAAHGASNVAVLARKHATLQNCHDALVNARIPTYRVGGADAVPATAEFRTIRGYLRLAVSPHSRRAFMSIAAAEHIDESALLALRTAALRDRTSLFSVFLKGKPRDALTSLDAIVAHLAAVDPGHNYQPAAECIREIMFREAITTPHEIVEALALASIQDQLAAAPKNSVTLCTIHAAKGLEWKTVFLIGMDSRAFPSPTAVKEGRIEEERRLCYVGCTRAEERLYLVHGKPDENQRFGVSGGEPSVFLSEMGT
jgi:superfamily I DNA/RNA helicase